MAGFGDKLLERLKEVTQATTEELATHAGVKLEQAYARLMALSYEGRTRSAGRGKNRAWSLPGDAPMVEPVPTVRAALGTSSHGWKPDLSRFVELDGAVAKSDKLLVQYPEPWRDTMLCSVTRPSGYFGVEGHAQVWNLRDDCYSVVDVVGWRERGWKVVRVQGEKDLARLVEES